MTYLQDKKNKNSKTLKIFFVVLGLLLFFLFRSGIYSGLSYVAEVVLHPVISGGSAVGGRIGGIGAYFSSKGSLARENENLKNIIAESEADRANYAGVVAENAELKEILGRKTPGLNLKLGAILAKPNQSPYDTLLLDLGENETRVGAGVFAYGSVPVGYIAEVYPYTSKAVLYSSPGEKTSVVIAGKGVSAELVGRGGGNFEMLLPRDLEILKGDQMVLPGINTFVVGTVETIISDPRSSFQKALLTSPVNIGTLQFIEVES